MSPQAPSPRELAAFPRLFLAALGWTVLISLGPGGVFGQEPHPAALLGVTILASVSGRPGPHAFAVEWLVAACAAAVHLEWIRYVFGPALIVCGLIYGIHGALFGVLLRRVQRGRPWAVAVPVAWCAMEALRFLVPVPLGMRWIQLGHHLINIEEIVGAARVVGPTGISFAMAAIAGLLVDIVRRNVSWWSVFAGVGPVGLLFLLSSQTRPPESVPGPVVLLVQPAVTQARKQRPLEPMELFRQQVELTREGLDSLKQAGGFPPDVVCWGETMLSFPLVGETLDEAVRMGALGEVSLPGISLPPDRLPQAVAGWKTYEEQLVSGVLLGQGLDRVLPVGCGFISGAEVLVLHEEEVRRVNSVCAWSPDGRRSTVCPKLELVPGGETLYGLEDISSVRKFVLDVAGYLPNLLAGEETGIMDLPARPEQSERSWRATGTVCYDNSFLHPYTDPLARGEEIDLHVICSNEAWYLDSWEMDQMICMSRMIAIATARPVIRATNSGVSCILDATGNELGRVQLAGVDRQVPGFLALEVPVPPREASVTPFCYFRGPLAWIFLLLAGVAAWGSARSGGYQEGAWE
jgi:apolipoprotein N-acyltransferase